MVIKVIQTTDWKKNPIRLEKSSHKEGNLTFLEILLDRLVLLIEKIFHKSYAFWSHASYAN